MQGPVAQPVRFVRNCRVYVAAVRLLLHLAHSSQKEEEENLTQIKLRVTTRQHTARKQPLEARCALLGCGLFALVAIATDANKGKQVRPMLRFDPMAGPSGRRANQLSQQQQVSDWLLCSLLGHDCATCNSHLGDEAASLPLLVGDNEQVGCCLCGLCALALRRKRILSKRPDGGQLTFADRPKHPGPGAAEKLA